MNALNETSGEFQKVEEESATESAKVAALIGVLAQRDNELIELKATLAAVSTKEMIIDEFRTSAVMTDLIGAEVKKYKQSDEFKEDMKTAVPQYKDGEEFQSELGVTVDGFYKSIDFRKVVAVKSGKATPHVMEC